MEYEWMQNSHDKKAQKILEDKKTSGKKTLGALGQQLNQTEKHKSKESMRAEKSILNLEAQTIKTDEDTFYAKSILQNILESSIDYSIVATDLNGKIIVWNEGAYRNYGYHASEMVNKKNLLFLHIPEDIESGAVQEFIQKALQEGKTEGVFERVRKDGSHFLASVTLSLRRDDSGKPIGFLLISKDVTEAKRVENQLIKTNEELEQFAYITSHDLKAPLRAIERLATWIEEDNADKIDEKSKENLALLRQRTLRLSNLIDGILQYSRAGRVDLNVELVDTKTILKDIIEGLNPEGQFEFIYPKQLPVFQTAKIPLIQVLSNLINNSIKHHHRKKGTIKIEVDSWESFYQFTIEDDGPGIEPEFFDKIFIVFQTLKSRDELESTGVGLSIVKKIVESQGGKVMVESQVGHGTAISFTWPKQIRKKNSD